MKSSTAIAKSLIITKWESCLNWNAKKFRLTQAEIFYIYVNRRNGQSKLSFERFDWTWIFKMCLLISDTFLLRKIRHHQKCYGQLKNEPTNSINCCSVCLCAFISNIIYSQYLMSTTGEHFICANAQIYGSLDSVHMKSCLCISALLIDAVPAQHSMHIYWLEQRFLVPLVLMISFALWNADRRHVSNVTKSIVHKSLCNMFV